MCMSETVRNKRGTQQSLTSRIIADAAQLNLLSSQRYPQCRFLALRLWSVLRSVQSDIVRGQCYMTLPSLRILYRTEGHSTTILVWLFRKGMALTADLTQSEKKINRKQTSVTYGENPAGSHINYYINFRRIDFSCFFPPVFFYIPRCYQLIR